MGEKQEQTQGYLRDNPSFLSRDWRPRLIG